MPHRDLAPTRLSRLSRLVVALTGTAELDRDELDLADALAADGWAVERVPAKALLRGRVPLDGATLVVGDLPAVAAALRTLGVDPPAPDDYPEELRPLLHRRLSSSTVGRLREQLEQGEDLPVFAKPKDGKRFTGRVFETLDDLRFVSGLSRHAPIWCADVVSWRTEWRVFVVDGEVVGRRCYAGDPDTAPDAAVVREAVTTRVGSGRAPAGWAIDVGVIDDGRTALVECNDGYSLGAYGLEPARYGKVLVARWAELLASAPGAVNPG